MISHFDLGGNKPPLHFLHANGYPPECYQPLLEHLQNNFHIFGMKLRPLWDESNMDELKDWHPYSDDLLRFLSDLKPGSVIGVGHSIGATVTLRAALLQPEKFRALILLDPVLFKPLFMTAWNITRALGLGKRVHPLIPAAQKRRRSFDDFEAFYQSYRTKPVFRHFSDDNLRAYIKGMTKPRDGGGYELIFPVEWEVHIYLTAMRDYDIWKNLSALRIPTLIIRGDETDTFLERNANYVKKKNPNIQIQTLKKATHLLPLEYPNDVAELIEKFTNTIDPKGL